MTVRVRPASFPLVRSVPEKAASFGGCLTFLLSRPEMQALTAPQIGWIPRLLCPALCGRRAWSSASTRANAAAGGRAKLASLPL